MQTIIRVAVPALLALVAVLPPTALDAQEARRRWEQMCQIRKDKFDYILPQAMRENGIDMWLVMMKEGHYDPLYDDLGRGYPDASASTSSAIAERGSSGSHSASAERCWKGAGPTTPFVAITT